MQFCMMLTQMSLYMPFAGSSLAAIVGLAGYFSHRLNHSMFLSIMSTMNFGSVATCPCRGYTRNSTGTPFRLRAR